MSSPLEPNQAGNPYAAPVARIDDLQAETAGEPAPRGLRLGAAIIDFLVFMVPVAMMSAFLAFRFAATHDSHAASPFSAGLVGVITLVVLVLTVVNLVFVVRFQQTIGKRLCGIRVVRNDGSPCAPWRIIVLRGLLVWVLEQIPLLGMLFALVDPLLIFGEDRRCVHDHIADTRVVRV